MEVGVPRRALYGFDPTRLTEVRRERGLSRSDLGRLSGVPYSTIWRWETGQSAPAPTALEKVGAILGVDPSELAVVQDDAQNLAHFRTVKGLAQIDAASELGLSKSTYSRLERGERPMTNTEVQKLAALLETDEEHVKKMWLRAHHRPTGPSR